MQEDSGQGCEACVEYNRVAGCGVVVRRFARVVKGLDLKSNGRCPRRFEPCSRRFVIIGDIVCIVVHCGL